MAKGDELKSHGVDLNAVFRDAVDRSGMTMYAIAADLGVSKTSITRPYSGERVPSLEMICRVAELSGLQVSIELKKRRRPKD